jgi:5-formyltetrahydrofolate cyclo-ligase
LIFLKEVLYFTIPLFYFITLDKQQLRKLYLAKRTELSADNCALLNSQILALFKTLDLTGVNSIHIFLPMVSRNEPDTTLIIHWLKAQHPNIKIAYPKTNFADLSITNFLDDADLKLAESKNGITEPVSGHTVDTNEIDMVVVPLLAFDQMGYRAGYGKGFYDRFMAKCKPGTRFIGLSFFDAADRIDDIDAYDIPLHECITPQKILTF